MMNVPTSSVFVRLLLRLESLLEAVDVDSDDKNKLR